MHCDYKWREIDQASGGERETRCTRGGPGSAFCKDHTYVGINRQAHCNVPCRFGCVPAERVAQNGMMTGGMVEWNEGFFLGVNGSNRSGNDLTCVINPLKPYTDITNVEQKEWAYFLPILKSATERMKIVYPNINGFNIVSNVGSRSYQNLFHLHFHLVPCQRSGVFPTPTRNQGFIWNKPLNHYLPNNGDIDEVRNALNADASGIFSRINNSYAQLLPEGEALSKGHAIVKTDGLRDILEMNKEDWEDFRLLILRSIRKLNREFPSNFGTRNRPEGFNIISCIGRFTDVDQKDNQNGAHIHIIPKWNLAGINDSGFIWQGPRTGSYNNPSTAQRHAIAAALRGAAGPSIPFLNREFPKINIYPSSIDITDEEIAAGLSLADARTQVICQIEEEIHGLIGSDKSLTDLVEGTSFVGTDWREKIRGITAVTTGPARYLSSPSLNDAVQIEKIRKYGNSILTIIFLEKLFADNSLLSEERFRSLEKIDEELGNKWGNTAEADAIAKGETSTWWRRRGPISDAIYSFQLLKNGSNKFYANHILDLVVDKTTRRIEKIIGDFGINETVLDNELRTNHVSTAIAAGSVLTSWKELINGHGLLEDILKEEIAINRYMDGLIGLGAINSDGMEPELRGGIIPISSIGTKNDVASHGNIPGGAALKTRAGNLESGSIQAIIHAAPRSFSNCVNNEGIFLREIALAVKNSINLASQNRYGYRRVAIPFIGSAIFGGGSDRKKLAKVVVQSALNQSASWNPTLSSGQQNELFFIVWSGEGTIVNGRNLNDYFVEAVNEAKRIYPNRVIKLLRFNNITELNGRVDAIINAANTSVTFGSGISGAIGHATGQSTSINQEAKNYVNNFNTRIALSFTAAAYNAAFLAAAPGAGNGRLAAAHAKRASDAAALDAEIAAWQATGLDAASARTAYENGWTAHADVAIAGTRGPLVADAITGVDATHATADDFNNDEIVATLKLTSFRAQWDREGDSGVAGADLATAANNAQKDAFYEKGYDPAEARAAFQNGWRADTMAGAAGVATGLVQWKTGVPATDASVNNGGAWDRDPRTVLAPTRAVVIPHSSTSYSTTVNNSSSSSSSSIITSQEESISSASFSENEEDYSQSSSGYSSVNEDDYVYSSSSSVFDSDGSGEKGDSSSDFLNIGSISSSTSEEKSESQKERELSSSTSPVTNNTQSFESEETITQGEKVLNDPKASPEEINNSIRKLSEPNKQPEEEKKNDNIKKKELLVDLSIKLIDKLDIKEAKEFAREVINKFVEKQNSSIYWNETEFKNLTSSQAVAQYVQKIIHQAEQQDYSKHIYKEEITTSSLDKKSIVIWIIIGVVFVASIGTFACRIVKRNTKRRK